MYLGRMLVVLGIVFFAAGIIVMFAGKIPFVGRLPGDINIHGREWSFHFPIVTALLLSLILTLILNLFFRR